MDQFVKLHFMLKIGFGALSHYFNNFLQTLYESLGVIWDCKSLNFVKKILPSYGH